MSDDLLRFRVEFPILANTTYLISNSLGAMPRGTQQALNEYAEVWATRGVRAWEEAWWMLAHEVGGLVEALMNAEPDTISLHQNVTQCQAGGVVLRFFREAQQSCLYRSEFSISDVFLGSAAREWRPRTHGAN